MENTKKDYLTGLVSVEAYFLLPCINPVSNIGYVCLMERFGHYFFVAQMLNPGAFSPGTALTRICPGQSRLGCRQSKKQTINTFREDLTVNYERFIKFGGWKSTHNAGVSYEPFIILKVNVPRGTSD